MKKIFLYVVVFSLLLLPSLAQGENGHYESLVPCEGIDCELCDIFTMLSRITVLFLGGGPILPSGIVPVAATLLFIYGGIKFYTAMGDSGKINEAKKIFTTVLVGLFIVYAAHYGITSFLCTIGYADCESWNNLEFCIE